ncbi:MAG: hypothetical protein FWD42_04190 [Solirubrobacterales bacterium]|nr:hypothetical protein [Solirubrobacterales bacterium]
MNTASEGAGRELVVASDGSIPADQLARLGVAPGTHLRVVQTNPAGTLAGSLPDFPDLSWEDFERGSALATHELTSA